MNFDEIVVVIGTIATESCVFNPYKNDMTKLNRDHFYLSN